MKRKLFWILYFGISTAAIVLAAVLLKEHIIFNWWSAIPIGYFLLVALCAWTFSSRMYQYRVDSFNFRTIFNRIKYDRKLGFFETDGIQEFDEISNRADHCFCQASLCILPLFPVFVLFLPTAAKICCGLTVLIPYFTGCGYACYLSHKAEEKRRSEIAKQRKEQERREEMGRWK